MDFLINVIRTRPIIEPMNSINHKLFGTRPKWEENGKKMDDKKIHKIFNFRLNFFIQVNPNY
jgi:hypothetical protein